MFFAYPNIPDEIGVTLETAIKKLSSQAINHKSWRALSIVGSFINKNIEKSIEEHEIFVADISILNFNVTYEIGYAIGRRKPIFLLKNSSIIESEPTIREVGIFDTIGFFEYSNSDELHKALINPASNILLEENIDINTKAPIYLLEQKFKTDFAIRITSRIKKARYIYRSFDPDETPRLSAYDAINQVAQSLGVLVSLLSKESTGESVHNLRAAFIAGLANGMNKPLCILQHGDGPVPIDYRDFVNVYYIPDDIDSHIADFAGKIAEAFQTGIDIGQAKALTVLQKIDFGASSAENEMRSLQSYYLKTDAYNRALRGEVQLVVGRKGSGKSAIFLQIRDKERSKSDNVVLDLKPEGYKLIKFKELLLSYLQEGTFQHTITAFWEYILLLEICHKVLENDKKKHLYSDRLFEPFKTLEKSYSAEDYLTEGDFSERMSTLMNNLTITYKEKYGTETQIRLSLPQITDLLYKSNIYDLQKNLINYLKQKETIWLLFDNIDKGWPSSGLKHDDFLIIRTLIDASRKIQRSFSKERIDLYPIVFLRNDVYELLVEETSDRQKEAKELLDWIDPDLLRELIKLRILSSFDFASDKFEDIWRTICISHYKGEETSQYLIDRSLMRPRFLINLLTQCKAFAVNFNHTKIESQDIEKGFKSYSSDLLTDINYEIRDVFPEAENILYCFISSTSELSEIQLNGLIKQEVKDTELFKKVIDLLLWHGFLGVRTNSHETTYIFTLNYNMQLLKGLIKKYSQEVVYVINPSFWPALLIDSN